MSLSRLEGGIEGPVVGYLVDRYRARRLLVLSIVMTGFGFSYVFQNTDILCVSTDFLVNMKAYVLLNAELGQEASIIDALQGVKEIITIYSLYGIYDLIIEMEADSMDRVKEVVFNNVRRLDHVKSTITLLTYGDPVINE